MLLTLTIPQGTLSTFTCVIMHLYIHYYVPLAGGLAAPGGCSPSGMACRPVLRALQGRQSPCPTQSRGSRDPSWHPRRLCPLFKPRAALAGSQVARAEGLSVPWGYYGYRCRCRAPGAHAVLLSTASGKEKRRFLLQRAASLSSLNNTLSQEMKKSPNSETTKKPD